MELHSPILQKGTSFFSTLSLQAIVEIPAKRFASASQRASANVAIFLVRQCQRMGRSTSISAMNEIIGGASDPILASEGGQKKEWLGGSVWWQSVVSFQRIKGKRSP